MIGQAGSHILRESLALHHLGEVVDNELGCQLEAVQLVSGQRSFRRRDPDHEAQRALVALGRWHPNDQPADERHSGDEEHYPGSANDDLPVAEELHLSVVPGAALVLRPLCFHKGGESFLESLLAEPQGVIANGVGLQADPLQPLHRL